MMGITPEHHVCNRIRSRMPSMLANWPLVLLRLNCPMQPQGCIGQRTI